MLDIPLGAEKWMTLPSDLNMLTSSMAWIGCTFIFFSVVCSFLSSVPVLLCTFFTFLRGVPLPLKIMCQPWAVLVSLLTLFLHRLKFVVNAGPGE